MASTAGNVEVHRDGDIAVVTLCRERKLNALSAHMESELLRVLRSPAVASSRAVVVTGGDNVFSAGADVIELREMTTQDIVEYYRGSGSVYEEFAGLPQPTVVAITGYCLAGGLEFALAADIRIADPAAVSDSQRSTSGSCPPREESRIVRAVGAGRARDLVLRGRRFDARQAEQWGIVTEIAAAGGHLAHAVGVAREFAAHSALALRITKQVLDVSLDAPSKATLLLEQLAYSVLNDASALSDSPSAKPAV